MLIARRPTFVALASSTLLACGERAIPAAPVAPVEIATPAGAHVAPGRRDQPPRALPVVRDAGGAPDEQYCEPQMFPTTPLPGAPATFQDAKTGLTGFKRGGQIVVAPRFRFAYELNAHGVTAAVDASGPVFIDSAGGVLARAFTYDNGPDYFSERLARIVDKSGKVGFIDDRGRIAIRPQFDHAAAMCHGRAAVCVGCVRRLDASGDFSTWVGGSRGVIDASGKWIVPLAP